MGELEAIRGDLQCTNGIKRKNICCAKSCGKCGGYRCEKRPGGRSKCCSENIKSSKKSCSTNNAPCLISNPPTRTPTTPSPTRKCIPDPRSFDCACLGRIRRQCGDLRFRERLGVRTDTQCFQFF